MVMRRMKEKIFISVVGESEASRKNYRLAQEVGKLIAEAGATLVCGGLKGVMEAAAKGARSVGGLTVGILPGSRREEANPYIDIPIVTGLGYARNKLVVKTGQAVIAIGGRYGTLSEIGFALGYGIPVIGFNTWKLIRGNGEVDQGIVYVHTPEEAVKTAFKLIKKSYKPRTRERGI
jgi:uncharacterized protein (TIGR00725 family)